MKFLRCMKHEFKRMIIQPELYVVLVIGCFFSLPLIGLQETVAYFPPVYGELGPAPEYSSILFQNIYGKLLYMFLCPIMACIPSACSYLLEKQNHTDTLICAACSRGRYIWAKTLVTFLSGFFAATLPFLLNLLSSELIFTRREFMTMYPPNFYEGLAKYVAGWNLFGELMFSNTVLNDLLHIMLIGLWSAGAALLTLGISYFYRQHYLLNLMFGPIILLLLVLLLKGFGLDSFNPQEAFPLAPDKIGQYLSSLNANDPYAEYSHDFATPSGWGIAAVYLLLYGSCGVLTVTHLIKHKDLI